MAMPASRVLRLSSQRLGLESSLLSMPLLARTASLYRSFISLVRSLLTITYLVPNHSGTPSTLSQRDGMLLHHTLGNGNFDVFANMSKDISCAMAKLNDPHEAATLIDHAIRECWVQSRPVYITLPTDMVEKKIEGERLKTPIDLSYPPNQAEKEDYVVQVVLKYLHEAKNPVILVDACAIRHRVLDEVHELIRKSGLPTFVTPMGKGAVDETLPTYGGK